ncbi:uncharacterized protein PRCAT00005382001 [Priceomyces carsonii]|uniref:uncharacterized protein n=1 Tax=Priceomyces carsonii TaxID=28549 RepID=UPI002EDB7146|nr:unnamed protein product [Priceomyces carsonii]
MSQDNNNSDTFLSRVFGLHSVYNQIQDNYQYYDPDIDNESNDDSDLKDVGGSEGNGGTKVINTNTNALLDSESDLDLSLASSQSPSMASFKNTSQHHTTKDQLDWENLDRRAYDDNGDVGENDGNSAEESYDSHREADDLLTSLNELPKRERKLHFSIPKVKHAKKFIMNKLQNDETGSSSLPLYNEPQLFRKPMNSNQPSIQTIYQQKNRRRIVIPPKERALYLWANITNMDEFLSDVYYYYRGKGLMNIIISSSVDLVILIFILGFTVFLKWGINYNFFLYEWSSNSNEPITLKDLIIPNFLSTKIPLSIKFLLFGFSCYVLLRLIQLYYDYSYKLKEIRNFYKYLIGISSDDELMTISWSTIVERLMLLKDYNSLTSTNTKIPPHYLNDLKSKVRLNAHDIANRIMRKENYMIALVNKDIFDLSINLPFLPSSINSFFSSKSVLTRTLEWNLKLCINNFIFNHQGQINSFILKDVNRNQLSRELSSRFKMAAIINLLLCPFIVIYYVLLYFFRYFNEYKSNPSSLLGLRQYTPWAEWKLREFNELPHFFIKRLHLSIGPANTYINQFPRGFVVTNMMKLINFIAGAITAVLVIMGLWLEDEEHNFWSFEITENKSSLFYISLFGTLWAITSNSINVSTSSNSSENLNSNSSSFFYDPEASLRYVSQFTHYLPSSWNNRLYTVDVKNEFCELFSLKIIIIVNEILSLILTPFILWFKILNSSGAIIDFFREFSIHVDGLGYVCYYAMFNFEEKDKNMMFDINKRRRRKKSPKKYNQRRLSDDIPLDNVKSKRKEKAKLTDTESNTDSSDAEEEYFSHYQDEKMIKSYMYFLESYGGANGKGQPNGASSPSINKKRRSTQYQPGASQNDAKGMAQSNLDPSPSLLYQGAGSSSPIHLNNLNQSISESAYNINYKFDENDEESIREGRKSGVLGMLNQFYKQDMGV